MRRFPLAVALITAQFGAFAFADVPRTIGWSDLARELPAAENPYYGLSADEARLVGVLVDANEIRQSGRISSPKAREGEAIALAALESVGIDGRTKVLEVSAFDAKLKASQTGLNWALIGQIVEIPGYVLPLELDGTMVTEFVLVPYAGACIHTPPPPSNQMIIVRSEDGFELAGLFEPVVVSGKLSHSGENRLIGLSDGESDLKVGYKMMANSVRRY